MKKLLLTSYLTIGVVLASFGAMVVAEDGILTSCGGVLAECSTLVEEMPNTVIAAAIPCVVIALAIGGYALFGKKFRNKK